MDIVQDETVGSLVDEYDIDGMANAMNLYASDPTLAQKVGERARDLALTNWTNEKSCFGLIEPDTLIRDNLYQLLGCRNGTKTNQQAVF
jgi:glycosyltransferase involved in cell wall biosynthesis